MGGLGFRVLGFRGFGGLGFRGLGFGVEGLGLRARNHQLPAAKTKERGQQMP